MSFDDLTVLQLLYAALGSVLVVYFVTSLIERAMDKRKPHKRRR